MHVSKEFLLEAVGLALLVALILCSVHLFQRASRLTGLLEEEQEQQMTRLEEYDLVKYDGLWVDGMTAVSYIKMVTGSYHIPVEVTTEQGRFVITKQEEYTGLRDVSSEYYINPLMKYQCGTVRDENGAVAEIVIAVQKEGEEE